MNEENDPRASRRATLVAFLLCAAAFGSRLSTIGLLNPDEGRYVEVAREMIATGDYLEPTIDGRNHWTKPPGTYWAIAACLRAFDFAPWSARIPAALAGWTTVLALFVFLRRRCGPVAAAVGAAALASTLHAFALFRMATPDALQTACVAVALAAVGGGATATVGRAFVATAALSASFLVKGPIGLFVFAAAHLGDWLCGGARRIPAERFRRGAGAAALGTLLVFAVGLQWYAFEALRRPELLRYWLFNEVAGRYFTDVHGRSQPWWYFVPVTLGALAPWTCVVVAAIVGLRARLRAAGKADAVEGAPTAADEPSARSLRAERFLLGWFLGALVLFSIGSSKLVTYVLPLMPPAAGLVGAWVARAAATGFTRGGRMAVASAFSLAALGAGAVAAILCVRHLETVEPAIAAGAAGAALGVIGFVLVYRRARDPVRTALTAAAFALAMWHGALALLGRYDDDLGAHGDQAWLTDAFAAEGRVPTGEPLPGAGERAAPESGAPLAFYGAGIHTFELVALRDAASYFPHLELNDENANRVRSEMPPPTIKSYLGRATPERPVYIATRGHLVAQEIAAAAGTPLVEVARRGRGRNAFVLLRTP